MKTNKIYLVTLTSEQIDKAKAVNGNRKQITHCLICNPYGQIFGTEKNCRKYFNVWRRIFPSIIEEGIETDDYLIIDFLTTFNLVNVLIEEHRKKQKISIYQNLPNTKKLSFFSRIFGNKQK